MKRANLRNVAIIAHVDHGKTTLVDQMLKQSGLFREAELKQERILDSNDQERERGITILAKNIALQLGDTKVNILDTPGHADFGGEVERVLRMADGCLLLVDAAEGPLPQTRFVLNKAFALGLKPIVVVNKIDRPDGRPQEVVNEVFDLFVDLDADDETLEFPILYASGRSGYAMTELDGEPKDLRPLLDAIMDNVPAPEVEVDAPLQMLVVTLDYSEFVGRIAIGRVFAGKIRKGQKIALLKPDGTRVNKTISQLYSFDRLGKVETDEVGAGDICAVVGLPEVDIGDTIADFDEPAALPPITVDEPTLNMVFRVNDSPFVGLEGEFVTSRQLRARLMKELESNVALRVEEIPDRKDEFAVAGRGLLHLGILIENMRREGFELSVGKPRVITKEIDGKVMEPVEYLTVDVPNDHVGPVMEHVLNRKGECVKMESRGSFSHIEFTIPARGLIGLRTRVLNSTAGEAIMHHNFWKYEDSRSGVPGRVNGVMISTEKGRVTAYALDGLQDRGILFVEPGDEVYEGQVVGEHCRDNDLPVNVCREKKLTNIRSATAEKGIILKKARTMSLEEALEYVEDDELVEITPTAIRLRKMLLKEADRKRQSRAAKA
ncbi:MAG: translational GTPase TypA [Gemmataceae bacterium]